MAATSGLRNFSDIPIEQLIAREFGLNPELRNGTSAYAALLREFHETGDTAALLDGIIDHAAKQYRRGSAGFPGLVVFNDGAADFLFDLSTDRTVLVWGTSRHVAANSRDKKYHDQFPRAGDGLDKGHAWSHAQGGREGGPNYFRQVRRLNQKLSNNGKLWRAIESHLAANAGLSAFVRLIYARGNATDKPDQVEYGVMPASGQFRAVIFPNT